MFFDRTFRQTGTVSDYLVLYIACYGLTGAMTGSLFGMIAGAFSTLNDDKPKYLLKNDTKKLDAQQSKDIENTNDLNINKILFFGLTGAVVGAVASTGIVLTEFSKALSK